MNDQSTNQPESQVDSSGTKRSSLAAWFSWSAAIILFLYILSIGPAVTLAATSRSISFGVVSTVYFPIFRFCEACQPAGRCLNWYLSKVGHVRVFFAPNHTVHVSC